MSDRNASDETETEMLERLLASPNADAARQFVRDRLDLRPDESVLSIGCGPGFEPASLAEDIGERGRVHGIDANEETLAGAEDRCGDLPQVSFERGDATDLPVPDDSYDVAVAKEVYQFVPDVETALNELQRILVPGGRAAVVTKDVDARVIHSSDRDRMRRAKEAYVDAVLHPHLGSSLVSSLPEAGLTVEEIEPRPDVHTEINEQVERGIEVQRAFMEADESFEQSEIEEWERDLRELDEAGEFLSCGTQFLYIARNPEHGGEQ